MWWIIYLYFSGNITTHLGAVVRLQCRGVVDDVVVTWTKYSTPNSDPIALSYNEKVRNQNFQALQAIFVCLSVIQKIRVMMYN